MDDSLSHHKDVSILEDLLRIGGNSVDRFDLEEYDHMSLVWARDVYEKINKNIVGRLDKFSKSVQEFQ